MGIGLTHLCYIHNVGVVQGQQDVDLPQRGQGEAVLLLRKLDLLERIEALGVRF